MENTARYPAHPSSARRTGGFTIVELLIVIVVIGILAAITVIAFNNVSAKARNSRTISVVQSYNKALASYRAVNNSYPPVNAGRACLGSGYTDTNSDGIADCGETANLANEDTTFFNALKAIITAQPTVNTARVNMPYQTSTFVGAAIYNWAGFKVNNVSNPYYIMYILEGDGVNCQNANIVMPWEDTALGKYGWPEMKTTTTQKYSWTDNKTTACVVPLENI
jgi:prepilin-type N-terminal cleavage/methylation domain-containing protein